MAAVLVKLMESRRGQQTGVPCLRIQESGAGSGNTGSWDRSGNCKPAGYMRADQLRASSD
uniref:Uncharacterized protein n=1 Tax=Leersia perrieri TaxID=77586 RepID=A0A0D9VGE7_9ORYZ